MWQQCNAKLRAYSIFNGKIEWIKRTFIGNKFEILNIILILWPNGEIGYILLTVSCECWLIDI